MFPVGNLGERWNHQLGEARPGVFKRTFLFDSASVHRADVLRLVGATLVVAVCARALSGRAERLRELPPNANGSESLHGDTKGGFQSLTSDHGRPAQRTDGRGYAGTAERAHGETADVVDTQ